MAFSLFFMNPVSYGGHVTFTIHLMRALRGAGINTALYKFGNRSELHERDFGYGEKYRNLNKENVIKLCRSGNVLITAPSKPMSEKIQLMLDNGARIVVHDPAEFKHGWDWQNLKKPPIVIRKTMLQYFKDAVFIKHPYDRHYKNEMPTGEYSAVSISRIDFDKHTEILLDANRLLPKKRKIQIYGFENRIYTRFNIMPKYPEWIQSVVKYPRELRYATELCNKAHFMCDMSIIKGDGGGTQYTFLEAIDAGSVCVLNREWVLPGYIMKPGYNCLAVSNGKELATLIKEHYKGNVDTKTIAGHARKMLSAHSPKKIAKQYVEEFRL